MLNQRKHEMSASVVAVLVLVTVAAWVFIGVETCKQLTAQVQPVREAVGR